MLFMAISFMERIIVVTPAQEEWIQTITEEMFSNPQIEVENDTIQRGAESIPGSWWKGRNVVKLRTA